MTARKPMNIGDGKCLTEIDDDLLPGGRFVAPVIRPQSNPHEKLWCEQQSGHPSDAGQRPTFVQETERPPK
jgi:hypothetical protein